MKKLKPFYICNEKVQTLQTPDLVQLVKPTVRIGDEEFVADSVARFIGPGGKAYVVVVEIHDCPYPPGGSGRRARLLQEAGVPLVRLFSEDIQRPDSSDHLRRKLREAIGDGVGCLTLTLPLPVSVN